MPGKHKSRDASWWRHYRAKRAKTGKTARTARKSASPTFIAWDGEGVTDPDGSHRYIMLANSAGDVLEAPSIGTAQALAFLCDHVRPGATNIIFGGSYDATMILRDLDRETIAKIMANETEYGIHVLLGGRRYSITYRQRKFLKIQRFRSLYALFVRDPVSRKSTPDYDASITLWDVLGFFQASFVEALRSYAITEGVEAIAAMKARRSEFLSSDAAVIRAYCIDECRLLVLLYQTLWEAFERADIRPRRHDGAGAAAGALLRKMRVKEHISPEPRDLVRAIACAYFGGRIELVRIGRANARVFGADLASAYPAAALDLPSLWGKWRRTTRPSGFAIARVRWALDERAPWYPLPYRRRNGTIVFASTGEGWVWLPELQAARVWCRRYGGAIDVLDAWRFEPATDEKPFAFVADLFERRKALARAEDGAEKAYKLALNSLYGKLAQQLGGTIERPPPYFALPWAGWITSLTRARIMRAGLRDPDAVIAFATDAIYSTRRLRLDYNSPDPRSSRYKRLGKWDPSTYADGVFVQAGVYWLRDRGAWKARYRGFDRRGMERPDRVLAAWGRDDRVLRVACTRFVTYGSALASRALWPARGTWRTIKRDLDLTGRSPKRLPIDAGRALRDRLVLLAPRRNDRYDVLGEPSAPFDSFALDLELLDGIDANVVLAEADEVAWA